MVKILVLSDLHLEQARFLPNAAATKACDVIVLAGDIHTGDRGIRWARETFANKPIVYVAGNHEFYGQDWDAGLNTMRETARVLDVQFLENDCVEISGVRFLGATLWTDFEYQGGHLVDKLKKQAYDWFLDYTAIKANAQGRRLTPDMSISRHQQTRAWLAGELAKSESSDTVVVTHHYPHKNSTPPRYALDGMTACYGSQLPEDLLLKAGLWIHGHTHASNNYRINGRNGHQDQYLQVICNPRGYLLKGMTVGAENANFNPGLLIESLPDGNWEERHDICK